MNAIWKRPVLWGLTASLGLLAAATGCQYQVNGQTLPSPYYLKEPVQYFPEGPWFKLQNEADQMKLYKEQAAEQVPPPPPVAHP